MDRKELGQRGEAAAAAYLQRAGMTVAVTNWRTAAGEIDIVAWDGPDLVMVEVKTRRSMRMGSPEEAVSPAKQRRLVRLARAYLAETASRPRLVRFDVVSLRVLAADRALLRHHRNAFAVPGD
ncbi:MAG TPA: YraN family protein [Coriobacteriia bacterium]